MSVVVDLSRRPPLPPPAELSPTQQQTWRDVMGSIPSGHITRAAFPILIQLCRSIDESRMLEGLVANFEVKWASSDEGLSRLDKLLSMRDRSTKTIIACSRSLRLTPQSVTHPTTASRRLQNYQQLDTPRPWDSDD